MPGIIDSNSCKLALYHPGRIHHAPAGRISHGALSTMTARIFKPAKNAMQSGTAKTREWQLDYEPEQPRSIEPLMGWTSSGDMRQQLTLHFDTKEDAVAYCEREGIAYQVIEPNVRVRRQAAYADNFAFRRGEPWTH
jgi:ETC complex I subunit conserved region